MKKSQNMKSYSLDQLIIAKVFKQNMKILENIKDKK